MQKDFPYLKREPQWLERALQPFNLHRSPDQASYETDLLSDMLGPVLCSLWFHPSLFPKVIKREAWKTSNSNSSGSTLEKVSGSWSMLKYLQIPKPCILLCCDLLRFSGFGPVHAGSQLLDFCSFSVYMLDCVQVLINLDCTSTHVNACTCDSLTLQWTWLWLLIITPTLVWVWELSYFRF